MKIKEKMKSLSDALSSINKQFGEGTVMQLGASLSGMDVPSFQSGSLGLDLALGIGGYPKGRLVEIFGPESSGKTTLTLHAIAEIQKEGGVAAFVDAEHAIDVSYAKRLGVNADELLVSQPDYGEQALEITNRLVSSGGVDLLVIDSVAALTPKAELDGEMGDQHVGLQARMMSQAMRKLTAATHQSQTTIIFINQIRHKIGVKFGSPEVTTGGNALKFYASVRLDVRKSSKILNKNGEYVGNKTAVKVVKNKLAPPFKVAEFEVVFGTGIHQVAEVLDHAIANNHVVQSGAYFSLGDERIGHGREAALKYLEEHQPVIDELKHRILDGGDGPKDTGTSSDSNAKKEKAA